uniref:Immunoglobulin superfamily member 10-like n=1 Tax=Xiphophorus maculatus TaxID=8083 RepID=M4AN26_XIPMA
PAPLLSWVLPNRSTLTSSGTFSNRIHMDTNGTLHISVTLPTDQGVYRCVAPNSAGAASASVRLHVSLLPPVIQQPREERLLFSVGWPVYAHCSARGAPTPILRWQIPDGTLVRPSQFLNGNIFVLSNGTLHIHNVGSKDTGNYECTASNAVGTTKRTVTIAVIDGEAKAKKTSNSSFFNKVRTSVIPSQTSTAFSPSKFSPVNPSDRSKNLSISSISPRGNSTRVASSSHTSGKISTVLQPQPVSPFTKAHIVSTSPSATTVNYEGTLNLYCSVSGNPPPTILWRTPTRKLDNRGQRRHHTVFDNGTLLIPAVGEGDEGEYICYAENQAGQDSMKFTNDRGHNFIKVQQGETATIPCRTTGDPAPTVTWFSPSFIIIPQNLGSGLSSQRVVAISDGTLEVSSAQKIDSGNYTCRASNSAGIRSMVVTLEVETSNATQSLPTRTVSLLQHSQRGLGMPDRSHSINSSPSGSVSKPTVSTSTSPLVSTINGETLRLHCPASTTRGSVSWTMPSGKILSRGDSGDLGRYVVQEDGTLIIKQVSVFDRGSYICRFSSHDSSSVSVTTVPVIVIAYPPRITIGPSPVTYTRGGVAVELPCMAIATPRATVSWETPDLTQLRVMGQPRIYGNLYLSPQGSLVIQNPTHRDTGFYRCIAKNVIGVDSKATYLHVM